nr:hypothetical protein [Nocardioides convexus]
MEPVLRQEPAGLRLQRGRGRHRHPRDHAARAHRGPALAADLRLDRAAQADRAHPHLADHRVRRPAAAALAVPLLAGHLRLVAGGHPGPRRARAGPRRGRPERPGRVGAGRRRARRDRGLRYADVLAAEHHEAARPSRRGTAGADQPRRRAGRPGRPRPGSASLFPDARISWIYASSEVGASIVVHDGRAGFPAAWLDRDTPGRPRISVQDGELVITSPHHGEGLDGSIRTGDAVVVEGDRVLITGRLNADEINVGGAKVSAGVVRSVLQAHPDVAWAHVRGRKAPLVGTIVVADVVLTSGATEDPEALTRITDWCRDRLPDYGVPRRVALLAQIPTKETLKSDV